MVMIAAKATSIIISATASATSRLPMDCSRKMVVLSTSVLPRNDPTKISRGPNNPNARAYVSIPPAIMPLVASGSDTRMKLPHCVQPNVSATFSNRLSISSNAVFTERMA